MLYYYDGTTINIVNEVWGLALAIICLFIIYFQKRRADAAKVLFRDFNYMACCTAAAMFCDILTLVLDGTQVPCLNVIFRVAVYLVFVLNAFLVFLVAVYFTHNIEGDFRGGPWVIGYGIVFLATLVLETVNIFTRWLYYYDAANVYHRAKYFWVSHGAAFLTEFALLVMVMLYRKQILPRRRSMLYCFMLLPCIAQGLQLLVNGIAFLYISDTLIMIMVMANIFGQNYTMMMKQQEELSEMAMNAMISQIQPHFLYNVLSAIMGIEGNPPETKQALADFGKYLRGNMDVLASTEPISMTKEMQHVRAYVELEKLRFQERLTVDYDLEVMDFEVAALSVQMMVENAIKHGIRPKPEGGRVLVETRELPDFFMIRIKDDGVGFDENTPTDDSRSHVGLKNTKERLRIMVDGDMEIKSIPGEGTTVMIMIPKMEYEDEYFSS